MHVRGLGVTLGGRPVLRGVDLQVDTGQIVGVLGANGAGKSTLVRALAGQVPSTGAMAVAGLDVRRNPAARLRIGLVPQDLGLYPHLTAAENLHVFGRLTGLSGRALAQRVSWAIAEARLSPVRDRRLSILSGGFRRRVNIAVALLDQPALLVLDEPTVGIDPPARATIDRLLAGLRGQGMGILLVTHDLEQAELLCDRVGFLRDGRLDPFGPPATLIRALSGGLRRLTLRLREPPGDAGPLLAAMGLRAGNDGLAWSGPIADAASLPQALARLADAGVGVREVTLREADLSVLFDASPEHGA